MPDGSHSCHLVAFASSGARVDMVGVMSFVPLNELSALFSHLVDWISYLEKQAQESGRAFKNFD